AHTLKGMSATMGYDDLANLTHKLENIFDGIRYDEIKVKTEMMDDLFLAVDHLNEMVSDVANGGNGDKDVNAIVDRLDKIENGIYMETLEEVPFPERETDDDLSVNIDEFQMTIIEQALDQGFTCYEMTVELSEDSLLKAARVYMVFDLLEKYGEVIFSNPPVSDLEEENFDYSFKLIYISEENKDDIRSKVLKVSEITAVNMREFSVEAYKTAQNAVEEEKISREALLSSEKIEATSSQAAATSIKTAPTKTIRVNIERLDALMNLFEELVIDRGRLEQISLDLKNNELQETVER